MPKQTPPSPLTPDLVDTRRAAEILGVSTDAVRFTVWRGKLVPAMRLGAMLIFRLADVLRWKAERKTTRPPKSQAKP
jgi:DNA-binding transcriptional MerR regulator